MIARLLGLDPVDVKEQIVRPVRKALRKRELAKQTPLRLIPCHQWRCPTCGTLLEVHICLRCRLKNQKTPRIRECEASLDYELSPEMLERMRELPVNRLMSGIRDSDA